VNHCGNWLVTASDMTPLPHGMTGGIKALAEQSAPEFPILPSDSGEPFGPGPESVTAELL
jgi:hypothetical protein